MSARRRYGAIARRAEVCAWHNATLKEPSTCAKGDIHAFQFAKLGVDDYRPAADCMPPTVPRHSKQDIGQLQRREVKGVPALWRVEGILVRVQIGNEGDHVRLIG